MNHSSRAEGGSQCESPRVTVIMEGVVVKGQIKLNKGA